jgi:hypothetical protein
MKTALIAILIALAVCGIRANLQAEVIKKIYTDKATYLSGEKVMITIRAVNLSSKQDSIIFGNGCEAYPYVDSTDYLMTFGLGCFAAVTVRTIPANDSIQWVYEYPYSSQPSKKLTIGSHTLYGYFQNGNTNSDTIGITVKAAPNSVAQEPKTRSFSIEQNYPNPFNPSTRISFSLSKQSPISISIFDLLGREIQTLVKGEMSNGVHVVNWTPGNIAGGVYYYKVVTDNYTETKKLIFAK